MSNTVWLSKYRDFSIINLYDIDASIPNVNDAVLLNKLYQKKINQTISEEEKAEYYQMLQEIGLYNDKWRASDYLEQMPTKLYLQKDGKLPSHNEHFFQIVNGYLVMDKIAYDVFTKFNLGKTHFSQVYIYEIQTEERLLETPYYFINIAEKRNFLLGERSKGIKKHPDSDFYMIREPYDNDIVLDVPNLDVDLWHDPMLHTSLFLSGDLVQALIQAGINKKELGLRRCQV